MSSVESLERKGEDDYDPFVHRKVNKPNSTTGTLIHMIKGSLGTGIMAMPLAFKNGGLIFGSIGTVLICIIYAHNVHLLVSTAQKACKRSRIPVLGFSETAHNVFSNGPPRIRPFANYASGFVDWMIVIDSILSICLYIVFIAKSLRDVLYNQQQLDWDTRIYILLLLIPLAIVTQVKELKHLVPFTAIANALIITSVGISLYFIFSEPISLSNRNLWPQLTSIPSFISTVLFAIAGIKAVLPIENKMKHPKHFLQPFGVMQTGLGFLTILYGVTGFFGYAQYGEETQGSVTLNLPGDNGWAESTRLLSAIAILVSLGFFLYIPMEIMWPRIESKLPVKWHNWGQIVTRLLLSVAIVTFALVAPQIEAFIGLLGSFGTAILSVLFPVTVDLVFRWPNDFGAFRWRLIKDVILCVFGLFVLVVGTYFSIMDIVAIYQ